jgi:hypothetical protein
MKTTVRVPFDITAEDIATGDPKSACYCAGALAIRRALPGETTIAVWRHKTVVELRGEPFPIPSRLASFTEAFDLGQAVEPMADELVLELASRKAAVEFCQRNGLPMPAEGRVAA